MKKKIIETLTPEQIAKFPLYMEKWTRIGLCTDPADRPMAEEGIKLAYQVAKLSPPKKIVWTTSPLASGLVRFLVKKHKKELSGASVGDSVRDSVWASVGDSVWDSVRDSVWASVGDSVWASVRDSVRASVGDSVWASVRDSVRASVGDSVGASVRDSVWASVGDSVWDSVRASVGDSVWDSVRASVWASVRDSVGDSVRASVRDSVRASVRASVGDSVRESGYGQHDANWIGFYDYFNIECNLKKQTENLLGMTLITNAAGWYLPHQHICWISERHNILHLDERGRLHKDGGLACGYPDGWGVYALWGVRVPEWAAVTPAEQLDTKKVLSEKNADIRGVLLKKIGIERALAQLPHKELDTHSNYTLYSIDLSEQCKNAVFLKMQHPGSKAWLLEGVGRECKTVEHAINWRRYQTIEKMWNPISLT